ncbi:MAG: DUF1800 family protein [Pseudomonadota bacterium]
MHPPSFSRLRPLCLATVLAAALSGCGRGDDPASAPAPALLPSIGQVRPAAAGAVPRYAAARFADQVSFGATPALVDAIAARGFDAWIDAQFMLPVRPLDPGAIKFDSDTSVRNGQRLLHEQALAAPDQLRQRVNWALSQFLVVSMKKSNAYGVVLYNNLLHEHAFGNYGALIKAISTSPTMGEYLDNIQNRPKSDECRSCAPNENYARELMQLFTLGLVKLNLDGSVQRGSDLTPLETYQQKDVQELARALTGWNYSVQAYGTDQARYEGKLVPETWAATHDYGAKMVLGSPIKAGGNPVQDLDAVVAILMAHPNMAPFVSLRMIQHLVSSAPSPAYVRRVATVFNNNGQGVRGDMKALIKAILLDPEARRGDRPGEGADHAGKLREPFHWYTGLLRGLGCTAALTWQSGEVATPLQNPYNADSVFSFYAPTDRAPGSNLLAPEQRLLNASELAGRLSGYNLGSETAAAAAGCDSASFTRALAASPHQFIDLVSERYFRGAMPVALRQHLTVLAPVVAPTATHQQTMRLLLFALASPYYGVIR